MIAQNILDYAVEYARTVTGFCDVTVCLPESASDEQKSYVDGLVDLRPIAWPRHRDVRNLRHVGEVRRLIKHKQPDIVHFLSDHVVWLNLVAALERTRSVVATVHDLDLHPGDTQSGKIPRWCVNWLRRSADAVVAVSEQQRQAIVSAGIKPSARVFMVPHPPLLRYAELAARRRITRTPGDEVRVLFFGRIYAYKGLEYLIRAAPLVATAVPNVRFVIAGAGDDLERCRRLIEDRQLFDIRNRFVSDQEAAQLFQDADMVAMPYIEASQSGVMAMAHAFGKPVIASEVGDLPYAVREAGMGLVVPPRDAARLAAAITRLAKDPGLRHRFGANGRAATATKLDPAALGARARDVYTRVASVCRGSAGAPSASM